MWLLLVGISGVDDVQWSCPSVHVQSTRAPVVCSCSPCSLLKCWDLTSLTVSRSASADLACLLYIITPSEHPRNSLQTTGQNPRADTSAGYTCRAGQGGLCWELQEAHTGSPVPKAQ